MVSRFTPVLEGLAARSDELAEEALLTCEREIPELVGTTGRVREAGLGIIRFSLHTAFTRAAEPADLTPQDRSVYARYFHEAARRGVPLRIQLSVIDVTVTASFRACWAGSSPDDLPTMLHFSGWTAHNTPTIRHLAAAAYPSTGGSAPGWGDLLLAGIAPPDREVEYPLLVVAGPVEPSAHGDRQGAPAVDGDARASGQAGHVAVRVGSDRDPSPQVWRGRRDGRQILLVACGTAGGEDPLETTRRIVGAPAQVCGGAVASTPDAVPAALDEAIRIQRIAQAVPGASGLHLGRDVVLEDALLTAPTAGISTVLDPLRAHPHLRESVLRLYDHALDRTATAADLGISRRALSDRLDRVRDLTGLDPRAPRGIQVLMTALVVDHLSRPLPGGAAGHDRE